MALKFQVGFSLLRFHYQYLHKKQIDSRLQSFHNSVIPYLTAGDPRACPFDNVLVVKRRLPRWPRRQGLVVLPDRFVLGVLEQRLGEGGERAQASLGEGEQPADERGDRDVGDCGVLRAFE
jgi:hypothetical protein